MAKPETRQEGASERTDLAEDRTIMAVERTFAGWMRTSFAAIGIGLAFRAIFGALEPWWLARGIATLFFLLAIIFAIGAERRACRAFDRLSGNQVTAPQTPRLRWIAYAVSAGAAVLAVAIWWMQDPPPGV